MARKRRADRSHGRHEPVVPNALHVGIGFVTNFFDTLGIGSFATTHGGVQGLEAGAGPADSGHLNVGHVLPTVIQALLFITAVAVEFRTLVF